LGRRCAAVHCDAWGLTLTIKKTGCPPINPLYTRSLPEQLRLALAAFLIIGTVVKLCRCLFSGGRREVGRGWRFDRTWARGKRGTMERIGWPQDRPPTEPCPSRKFPSLHDMWHDTDAVRPTTAKARNPASGFRPLLPFESLQCCFCLPKPPLVFPAPGVYSLDSGKRAVILT